MKLGEKVKISKKYKSYLNSEKQKNGYYLSVKRYKIIDIPEKEGIFCGIRVLKEGEFGQDVETNVILKSIKVALVATNLQGLIYVPFDSL